MKPNTSHHWRRLVRAAFGMLLATCVSMSALAQDTSPNTRIIPFATDDDTEISAAKIYTHVLDFASPNYSAVTQNVEVNDVQFLSVDVRDGAAYSFERDGKTYGFSGLSKGVYLGNEGTIGIADTENIYQVLRAFNNGSQESTMTFTGLTPGACYEARFYNRPWVTNRDRFVNFIFKPDENAPETHEKLRFNADRTAGGRMLVYRYVAGANGELNIYQKSESSNDTLHLYAFSNEEVAEFCALIYPVEGLVNPANTVISACAANLPDDGIATFVWDTEDRGETDTWTHSESMPVTAAGDGAVSHTLSGLEYGCDYYVRVKVTAGGETVWSPVISLRTIPTSGWSRDAAGTYDMNDPANWADGIVNGLWGEGLIISGAQYIEASEDTSFPNGITLRHQASGDIYLRGKGARRVLTLNGDITNAVSRSFHIGSSTETQALDLDFDNLPRTIYTISRLNTYNQLLNLSELTLSGGGSLYCYGSEMSAPDADIIVDGLSTLVFERSTITGTGAHRAKSIHLKTGFLTTAGRSGIYYTNSINTLVVDTDNKGGGVNLVTLTPNSGAATILEAKNIQRENHSILFLEGGGAGLGTSAPASNVGNFFVDEAPELIGPEGGQADTPSVGVVPWMYYSTSATPVTYDPATGFRGLNSATEFRTYTNGYSGVTLGDCENIRIPVGATVTFTEDVTVNSIYTGYGAGTLNSSGKIHVKSGLVMLRPNATVTINAPLDFTGVQAVIGAQSGKTSSIYGGISGDKGAVIYSFTTGRPTSTSVDIQGGAVHTITGDIYIHGRLHMNNGSNFLPYGDREGNTYVYGQLNLWNGGIFNANGLFGGGTVIIAKGGTLIVGHRDADSVYNGIFTSNGHLQKAGMGTLTLTGSESTYTGYTRIYGGVLEAVSLNRITNPAASSSLGAPTANATIQIGNADTTGTLRYLGPGESTDRVINLAGTTGGATLDASGSGAVVFESAFTATVDGAKTLTLTGTNTQNNAVLGAIPDRINKSTVHQVSLLKTGTGTWVLGGANTYTGATTVEEGTLLLDGGEIVADVTVAAGAAFGGNGTVDGDVTLEDTATFVGSCKAPLVVNGVFDAGTVNVSVVDIPTEEDLKESGIVSFRLLSADAVSGSFTLNPEFTKEWFLSMSRDGKRLYLTKRTGTLIFVK